MMWQQPMPPMSFTLMMAMMRPMMPTTPYQAINYMGHQFGLPPPLKKYARRYLYLTF